ncbi:MAG: hypothetical protein ACTSU2_12735 [Promethearchaeota archaeon]
MLFDYDKEDYKICPYCGYRMTKPFPKICPNPNCLKVLDDTKVDTFADHIKTKVEEGKIEKIFSVEEQKGIAPDHLKEKDKQVSEIKISRVTAASKIKGVRVKKKSRLSNIDLSLPVVVFPKSGQYFKNVGVVTTDRTILYNRNPDYEYINELSTNLDFISSSILGGEIDKLYLKAIQTEQLEKVLYIKSDDIIYFLYGSFTNKTGQWILKEIIKAAKDIFFSLQIKNEVGTLNSLDKVKMHNISIAFDKKVKYIFQQYLKASAVFTDKIIPPLDEALKVHYVGMSYRSIGTISKILGDDLPIELPPISGDMDPTELKESLITAKIEAIAANTIANTNAIPQYLSVKLGYEHYRYIYFKELPNNYFIYFLLEGNIIKMNYIWEKIKNDVLPLTENPFKGDLTPFFKLKEKLKEFFKVREF